MFPTHSALKPRPLSQVECGKLRSGQWVAILWRRASHVPHARPGPWPYRVDGQYKGHAVIAGHVLTDVSVRSEPDKNMVWLLEGVPNGCSVNEAFGVEYPG